MSRHGEEKKKKAWIKLLYHGYLQAILQQERIEGECFHKRVSQGLHSQCDVRAHSYGTLEEVSAENPPLAGKTSLKDRAESLLTPTGDSVTSVPTGGRTIVRAT